MSNDLDLHAPGASPEEEQADVRLPVAGSSVRSAPRPSSGDDLVTASFLLDRALSDFASEVMERVPFVVFYLKVEEGLHSYLTFPQEVWQDMGSPDEVTITIEPGDGLND